MAWITISRGASQASIRRCCIWRAFNPLLRLRPDACKAALLQQGFRARTAEHANGAVLDLVQTGYVNSLTTNEDQVVGDDFCQPAIAILPFRRPGQGEDADVRLRLGNALRFSPGHELDETGMADAPGNLAHHLVDEALVDSRRFANAGRRNLEGIGGKLGRQQAQFLRPLLRRRTDGQNGERRGKEHGQGVHGRPLRKCRTCR
jgi:hypothetical protein